MARRRYKSEEFVRRHTPNTPRARLNVRHYMKHARALKYAVHEFYTKAGILDERFKSDDLVERHAPLLKKNLRAGFYSRAQGNHYYFHQLQDFEDIPQRSLKMTYYDCRELKEKDFVMAKDKEGYVGPAFVSKKRTKSIQITFLDSLTSFTRELRIRHGTNEIDTKFTFTREESLKFKSLVPEGSILTRQYLKAVLMQDLPGYRPLFLLLCAFKVFDWNPDDDLNQVLQRMFPDGKETILEDFLEKLKKSVDEELKKAEEEEKMPEVKEEPVSSPLLEKVENQRSRKKRKKKLEDRPSKRRCSDTKPPQVTIETIPFKPIVLKRRPPPFRHQMKDNTVNFCKEILRKTQKSKYSWVFAEPVNLDQYDDYTNKVKKPMDFGTIEDKLNRKSYQYLDDFYDDMNLVFRNCKLYNELHTPVYMMAEEVEKEYFQARDRRSSMKQANLIRKREKKELPRREIRVRISKKTGEWKGTKFYGKAKVHGCTSAAEVVRIHPAERVIVRRVQVRDPCDPEPEPVKPLTEPVKPLTEPIPDTPEKKSKYQGLVYDVADDMWKAEAVIQNKKVHLCSAKDEDLCAKRARRKSKELKITRQKIGVNLKKAILGPKEGKSDSQDGERERKSMERSDEESPSEENMNTTQPEKTELNPKGTPPERKIVQLKIPKVKRKSHELREQEKNLKEDKKSQKKPKKKSSKYLNVRWSKRKKVWRAQLTLRKKTHDLGAFETEVEAAIAINDLCRSLKIPLRNPQAESITNTNPQPERNKSSKYVNVCWSKRIKAWRAELTLRKHTHDLGVFETELEAALAINDLCRSLKIPIRNPQAESNTNSSNTNPEPEHNVEEEPPPLVKLEYPTGRPSKLKRQRRIKDVGGKPAEDDEIQFVKIVNKKTLREPSFQAKPPRPVTGSDVPKKTLMKIPKINPPPGTVAANTKPPGAKVGLKSEAGRPEDLEIRRLLSGKERKRKRAKTPDIPRKRARDSSVEVIERFDGNLPHDSRPSRLKRKRIHDLKTTQPQKARLSNDMKRRVLPGSPVIYEPKVLFPKTWPRRQGEVVKPAHVSPVVDNSWRRENNRRRRPYSQEKRFRGRRNWSRSESPRRWKNRRRSYSRDRYDSYRRKKRRSPSSSYSRDRYSRSRSRSRSKSRRRCSRSKDSSKIIVISSDEENGKVTAKRGGGFHTKYKISRKGARHQYHEKPMVRRNKRPLQRVKPKTHENHRRYENGKFANSSRAKTNQRTFIDITGD